MSFLNPIALLGMAAAAIPLLLHLLNLRKTRTVEFSSLRFLKELQKSKIRRIKLKQWLLLLLRTLLIVFAVLAFARPVYEGGAAVPGTRSSASVVIILDDSPSMLARDERGLRLRRAADQAGRIVELLQEGDEAAIVRTSRPEDALDRGLSRNRTALSNSLTDLTAGGGSAAGIERSLAVASRLLSESTLPNREVYVISDLQSGFLEGLPANRMTFAAGTIVGIIPIGGASDAPTNIGIDSIDVVSSIFEPDKPIDIEVSVTNYGANEIDGATVALYLNDRRSDQKGIALAAGESGTVQLSSPPRATGLVTGYVEVGDDALPDDDRRYFAVRTGDASNVALFGTRRACALLQLVYRSTGLIAADQYEPSRFGSIDLQRYSAVIVVDPDAISSANATRLEEFMRGGGGLVVWAGPQTASTGSHAWLSRVTGISVGDPVRASSPDAPLSFGNVEIGHPMFAGVFDRTTPNARVESPSIRQVLPAQSGVPIITLRSGESIVAEGERHGSRTLFLGLTPDSSWSDLPTRSIFIPLAIRSALYVAAQGEVMPEFVSGEEVYLRLTRIPPDATSIRITGPDNLEEFVDVRRIEDIVAIEAGPFDDAGVYSVFSDSREISRFVVNWAPSESDLRSTGAETAQARIDSSIAGGEEVRVIEPTEDYRSSILQARSGIELWNYFLILALVCAFAEMIVGRSASKKSAEE